MCQQGPRVFLVDKQQRSREVFPLKQQQSSKLNAGPLQTSKYKQQTINLIY